MAVTVKFISAGIRLNLAYSVGEVAELPKSQADELVAAGMVEILKDYNTLPPDIPGREQLLENGIKTIEELSHITDFTELEGISKTIDKRLKAYLKK